MTVWTYPISWTKMKMAWTCLLQLQFAIDKKPPSDVGPNYWMQKGWWVQYIFELYFNQKLNRSKKGRRSDVMERVAQKVLDSGKFRKAQVTYPPGKTEKGLVEDIKAQVAKGHQLFYKTGLLSRDIRSEVTYRSVFHGMRLYAKFDFEYEEGRFTNIYDGKGNLKEDADERQLLMYALAIAAAGRKIGEAALLYWNHGKRPVNVSPRAIRQFAEGDFAKARTVFEKLRRGTGETLPASPSKSACYRCAWKSSCPFSVYKREQVPDLLVLGEEVGFDG